MTNEIALNLDLAKWPSSTPSVVIRQGERGATTLVVYVTCQGEPVDVSGASVYLTARLPGGATIEEEVDSVAGSTVTHVLSERWSQAPGMAGAAYLMIARDDDSVITSSAFGLSILPDSCEGGGRVAEAYSSRVEEMLRWCRETFLEHEAERDAEVEEAVDGANDAAERANAAAKAVENAISGTLDPLFGEYLKEKIVPITNDEIDEWWGSSAIPDPGDGEYVAMTTEQIDALFDK